MGSNRTRSLDSWSEEHVVPVLLMKETLTPDDRGGTKDFLFKKLQPRARENVILELGFFIRALGRNRVCALYRAGGRSSLRL